MTGVFVPQLPGISELHDRHVPPQPPGVPQLHHLQTQPHRRRLLAHQVFSGAGAAERLFSGRLQINVAAFQGFMPFWSSGV